MGRCSRIVHGLAAAALSCFGVSQAAAAAIGTPLATYSWGAGAFVANPSAGVIYASIPSQNSVAVIDASTLAVRTTVPIGSSPRGMALSPDGTRLYVADSGSNFIGVMDTATNTALSPLATPGANPQDLEFGTNNRLFVSTSADLRQIDATTGASAGPNAPNYYANGLLEISPDKKTLYNGQLGSSPNGLVKIDVSGGTLRTVQTITTGSNGEDLQLSADGSMVAAPNGAPYSISIYRTSDLLSLGSLETGAYPDALAFSPDGNVAYTVHTAGKIDVYDLTTFLNTAEIDATQTGGKLFVDPTGRYLFSSYGPYGGGYQLNGVAVYSTGRVVATPEPATGLGLAAAVGGLAVTRRRKRKQ